MTKITAIHSGDWYEASAKYLILPPGMDIQKEQKAWRVWYKTVYCTNKAEKFISLFEWCLQRGARIPTNDELEVFEEI